VDLLGRPLQVGVELHRPRLGGVLEPGRERRLLAEVARKRQVLDPLVGRCQRLDPFEGGVGGAVVDEDHPDVAVAFQLAGDPLVGQLDRLGLVVAGHHRADGQLGWLGRDGPLRGHGDPRRHAPF
jgi:hypothetical protein